MRPISLQVPIAVGFLLLSTAGSAVAQVRPAAHYTIGSILSHLSKNTETVVNSDTAVFDTYNAVTTGCMKHA
jgi:hypothetical protein